MAVDPSPALPISFPPSFLGGVRIDVGLNDCKTTAAPSRPSSSGVNIRWTLVGQITQSGWGLKGVGIAAKESSIWKFLRQQFIIWLWCWCQLYWESLRDKNWMIGLVQAMMRPSCSKFEPRQVTKIVQSILIWNNDTHISVCTCEKICHLSI